MDELAIEDRSGLYDHSRGGHGRGQHDARITVAGFAIFIVASLAWMADGWFENRSSLVIQNVILLLINILGVWRWLPRAEKEAGVSGASPAPTSLRRDHAARARKRQ